MPSRVEQNLQATVQIEGGRARIVVDAIGDDRAFRNGLQTSATLLAPDGSQSDLALPQSGPGRYEIGVPVDQSGAYLLHVVQRTPDGARVVAQHATGFVSSQSTEYWQLRPNRGLLQSLSRVTGGKELTAPADAFAHNLQAPGSGRELWRLLAIAAVLLFLVDVAVRRLRISLAALERFALALRARLLHARARPAAHGVPAPQLARLLAVKSRTADSPAATTSSTASRLAARRAEAITRPAVTRPAAARPAAPAPPRQPIHAAPARAPSAPARPQPTPAGGTAARLLAAKQRARTGKS